MPRPQPEPVISDPALSASSLLELFRADAEGQLRTLDGGLRELLHDPGSAAAIETCLCAAGSLKDAARMAGHRAASGLAGALEDCLVAAQRGRIVLRRHSAELLLGGVGLLKRAAATEEVNLVRWTGELRTQAEGFLGGVKRLRDGGDEPRPAAPPATASAAPEPGATPPAARVVEAQAPAAADSGLSLLEPFRKEVRSQEQQLLAGMLALEQDAAAQDTIETCRRAAHSLMGASRSVGLSAGLLLGHALESSFAAALQGRIVLRPDSLAVLRRGVDLFARIAGSPPSEFGAWVRERRPDLKAALTELESVRHAPGAAAPAAQRSGQSQEDIDSVTLLDLFHDEAQNLSQTLTAGLLALAREPGSPQELESCMRAAHSFKGAARIVGLTMAVSLSRAMEDTFTAAQRGEIHLGQEAVDLLLRGAELLAVITRAQDTGFGQWGSGKRADVEVFLASLKHLRETADAAPATAADTALAVGSAAPVAAGSTAAGLAHDDRLTLFDLFHEEAEHLAQSLTAGLLALEHAPTAAEPLEACVHAAASIKDAMRMVGRTMGASLARALEEYLMAAQHGITPLRQGSIDLLLRGTELVAVIARAPEAQFGQWGSEKRAEVEVFLAALKQLRESAPEPAAAPSASAGDDSSFAMTPAAAPGASAGDGSSFSMTPAAAPGASAGDGSSFAMTPAAAPGASAGDGSSFAMTPAAPGPVASGDAENVPDQPEGSLPSATI